MKASTVPPTCKLSLLQIADRIFAMPSKGNMFQGYMETEKDGASGSEVLIGLEFSVCCVWVSILKSL